MGATAKTGIVRTMGETMTARETVTTAETMRTGTSRFRATPRGPAVLLVASVLLPALLLTGCLPSGASRADEYFDDPRIVEILDAAGRGDVDRISELEAAGADVDDPANDHDPRRANIPPLWFAIEFMTPGAVTALLDAGADPAERHLDEYNAIGYAILRDKPEAIEAMLDHDPALANAPDRLGANALYTAVHLENRGAAEMLLDAGADIDSRTTVQGLTPLFAASQTMQADTCLWLVRRGADAGIRDATGHTFLSPLFNAEDSTRTGSFLSDREELVGELRERGFPVETGR